jgi:chaperonin GroES
MKYTPRQDFVVLKMDEQKEVSKNGILLPQSVKEDRLPATVLAVGPGRVTEHGHTITVDDLAVGDRVVFNKFSALELNERERLYLIRHSDIGCKIDD